MTTDFASIVGFIAALSAATEKLTDITKAKIWPEWAKAISAPEGATPEQIAQAEMEENRRKGNIQTLSVVCGIITAALANAAIGGEGKAFGGSWAATSTWFAVLGLGVLASGGAAFWNSILEYLLKVKDIKTMQAEAERKKQP